VSATTISNSVDREANVQVILDGTPLFAETFLGIVMNDYAIALINARIAALAHERAADPVARCRAYLAARVAKQRRENEIRRKYTGT